jgi:hypothetical protein
MIVFYDKNTGDVLGTMDGPIEANPSLHIEGREIEQMEAPSGSIDSPDEHKVVAGKLLKKDPEEINAIKRSRKEAKEAAKKILEERKAKIDKVKDPKLSDKEKVDLLIDLLQ